MASSKTMHPALYRASQFLAALKTGLPIWAGGREGLLPVEAVRFVRSILITPPQQQLFERMPPNDQRHAIAVAHNLQQAGYQQVALMQAALLHDVGKSIGQPLIHRVLIVLLEAFWPAALAWLSNKPTSQEFNPQSSILNLQSSNWWRRPFVVHAYHPMIGAVWAQEAGCDPLAVTLILKHQDKADETLPSLARELLAALQWADDLN
jgi:hypothetical protein